MKISLQAYLSVAIFCAMLGTSPAWADAPIPSESVNINPVDDEKNQKSFLGNLLSTYNSIRGAARVYVNSVSAVSSVLYDMHSVLAMWERIAKKVEFLASNNPFDRNPATTICNLEEDFFQNTDDLMKDKIPTAIQASKDADEHRDAAVRQILEEAKDIEVWSKSKEFYKATMIGLGLQPQQTYMDNKIDNAEANFQADAKVIAQIGTTGEARRSQGSIFEIQNRAFGQSLAMEMRCVDESCNSIAKQADYSYQAAQSFVGKVLSEIQTQIDMNDLLSTQLLADVNNLEIIGKSRSIVIAPLIALSNDFNRLNKAGETDKPNGYRWSPRRQDYVYTYDDATGTTSKVNWDTRLHEIYWRE